MIKTIIFIQSTTGAEKLKLKFFGMEIIRISFTFFFIRNKENHLALKKYKLFRKNN